MKKGLLLVLLAIASFGRALATPTETETALFARLSGVNAYWAANRNAVPAYVQPLANDRAMIALHLELVEKALRAKDVTHLSAAQKKARTHNLDNLNSYRKSGAFPINTTHAYRLPIFIDPFDNFCAVGYLIKASGHESLSRHISANTNFAYLADMNYPELETWAANSGLTKDELAWIQPAYAPNVPVNTMLGGINGTVRALAQDANNQFVYAVGEFTEADGQPTNNTAYYGMGFAGPFWSGMAAGLSPTVSALQWYNGELYAAGSDLLPTGASHSVVKWNGSQWQITSPTVGMVKAMAVYNNALYAAGHYGMGGAYLARWDGNMWVDLMPGSGISINGEIYALHVHDNKLYMGGEFTVAGISSPNILAFNGSQLSGVGGGLPAKVRALTTFKNYLFGGGDFENQAGDVFGIARLNGTAWENRLIQGGFSQLSPVNGVGYISSFATDGAQTLVIGGSFHVQPGMIGNFGDHLGTYTESPDGQYWGYNGLAMFDKPVHTLLLNTATNILYMGGEFTQNMNTPVASVGYMQFQPLSTPEPITVQAPNVFPNPFATSTTIQAGNLKAEAPATILVFDVLGKKVLEQQQLVDASQNLKLNRGQLPAGTYLLQVKQADKLTGMTRLVVQ